MKKEIRRSIISGKTNAPASTAMAHRAIFLASLSDGQTIVSNLPRNSEIDATIGMCNSFGADIVVENKVADIFGTSGNVVPANVDCGECNTTLKFALPLASLYNKEITLNGTGKLAIKDLHKFCEYLGIMSVSAEAHEKHLPIKVKGPMQGSELAYFPALGTQFLSGLLLSAPLRSEDTVISIIDQIPGRRHIDATIEMMKKSKIAFTVLETDLMCIPGLQEYDPPEEIVVPSSEFFASYLLLAGALCGKVEVKGLHPAPKLEEIFRAFSANVKREEGKITVSTSVLEGTELDAVRVGRYLPHALAMASLSAGQSTIKNLPNLNRNDKMRVKHMIHELSGMGAQIEESANEVKITGGKLKGAQVSTHDDSHVGMALAVAGAAASGPTTINSAECIEKSYGGFFSDLAGLGLIVR